MKLRIGRQTSSACLSRKLWLRNDLSSALSSTAVSLLPIVISVETIYWEGEPQGMDGYDISVHSIRVISSDADWQFSGQST
jgi:hypothetical protein